MERLICIVIGYIFGLIQSGYLYGKANHMDIRQYGSGNAGSTNVLRVMGKKAGAIVFLGDFFKAVLAMAVCRLLFKGNADVDLLALYAGLGVTLGHNFPFYLKFKGGKGIACMAGIMTQAPPAHWRVSRQSAVHVQKFPIVRNTCTNILPLLPRHPVH